MKRKDFQQLAAVRLKEAKILLANHCWSTERHDFPDKKRVNASYTHDVEELLVLAELTGALPEAAKGLPELSTNWKIVRTWRENSRYQRPSHEDAEELLGALDDRKGGILRWLKLHW